jgi:hypothetical protein
MLTVKSFSKDRKPYPAPFGASFRFFLVTREFPRVIHIAENPHSGVPGERMEKQELRSECGYSNLIPNIQKTPAGSKVCMGILQE